MIRRLFSSLFSTILLLFFAIGLDFSLYGQGTLGYYSTASISGSSAPIAATNVSPNVSFSSLGRGSGISPVVVTRQFASSGWATSNSIDVNDYYEFTITPTPCINVSLVSVRFNLQSSKASGSNVGGPTRIALRSNYANNNFATDLLNTNLSADDKPHAYVVTLTFSNTTSPLTFRLYGYSAEAAGGTLAILDGYNTPMGIEVDGTTSSFLSVGGTIAGGASPICQGSGTGTMTLSGYSGSILYWERQINSGGWTSVGNTGKTTYSDTPYSGGIWQYRAAVQNGTCSIAYSSVYSVTVDPTTTVGNLGGGNTPICQGSSLGTLTLGASTGNIVRWEKRLNGGSWINISNTASTFTEVPSSSGTWDYRAVVQSGSCSLEYSNNFQVIVNPTLTINLGTNPVICQNTVTALLQYTATTGNPNAYSIDFDGNANAAGLGDVNGWGLSSSPISINVPWNIAPGVYNGILTVGTTHPVCSSIGYPFTITVNAVPTSAGAISGSPTVSAGQTGVTYAVPVISGATGYIWAYSGNGATINGTGNSVTVDFSGGATSGNLTVYGTNSCGNGVVSASYPVAINSFTSCVYNENTYSNTLFTPCINLGTNVETVTSSFSTHQYFLLNVIKGLNYQVYTCSTPAAALKMTIYEEGNPSGIPIASSFSNSGNTCNTNANNVYLSFISPISGQVRVLINNLSDCTSTSVSGLTVNVNVSGGSNTEDDKNKAGVDSWVGHIYDGTNSAVAYGGNFSDYLGYYTASETFQEGFGTGGTWPANTNDDATCFNILSNGNIRAYVKDLTYSVRYRMNSTKRGLYGVDLTGDDGNRLTVDGSLVYSDWSDHSPRTTSNVLISLSGSSSLLFDYYENGGQNVVGFNNLVQILSNTLSTNITQDLCLGNIGTVISGDTFGALPTGISLAGTGYQWTYSTSLSGPRTNIPSATGATFTPNTSTVPFNSPGTYYIYRNAILSSVNNVSPNPYVVTNESNAATIVVTSASITPSVLLEVSPGNSICEGTSVTFTATANNIGGGLVSYNFKVNGEIKQSGTLNTFITNTLANGNTVTCEITVSGGSCLSTTMATSDGIIMSVAPLMTPSIVISSSETNVCQGSNVTFTAMPTNGGSSPFYQWKVNGSNAGTNNPSFTYAPANSDMITCELTSDLSCVTSSVVTSNAISMKVISLPTAFAGSDVSTCASSPVNIAAGASATNYSEIAWASNGSGTFTDANSLTLCSYTPSADDIAAGSVLITLTAKANGNCADVISTKVLSINALPAVFNVTGGGFYCIGGSGVEVGLSGSETGVSYQLYKNGTSTGSPIAGTGSAVNFGNQTAGTYTVKATNSTTSCTQDMNGTVVVTDADTGKPTISSSPDNRTVACSNDLPVVETIAEFKAAGGRVSDNCTAEENLKLSLSDVFDLNGGCRVTRTYTIKDEAGNQAICTQVFSITDVAKPVITCNPDLVSSPNTEGCAAMLPITAPTAISENCSLVNISPTYSYRLGDDSGATPVTGTGNFTATFPEGNTTIYWTITDLCGNTSTPCAQIIYVGFNLTDISYDSGSAETGSGSGVQPIQTSTHEYFVDNKTPDEGYNYDWALYESNGTTKVTSCTIAKVNNNPTHIKITFTGIPVGDYILSVIKTKDGTTCKNQKTLTVVVLKNTFDTELKPFGNQCQAGETGTPSTIIWEVTFSGGGIAPYSLHYAVNLTDESNNQTIPCSGSVSNITLTGTTPDLDHQSGCDTNNMPYMRVEKTATDSYKVLLKYTMSSVTARNFTASIQIDATDQFSLSEIKNNNNSENLDLHGVPNTSEITTD